MHCKVCLNGETEFYFSAKNVHGRSLLSDDSFDIFKCPACNVIFTGIDVNSEYYKKYYPADYYQDYSGNPIISKILNIFKNLSFRRRLSIINKFSGSEKRILEIGCAKAEFLNWLPLSFKKFAVEINESTCDFVKENYPNINIINGRIEEENFGDIKFDIIVFYHVLEHIEVPMHFFKSISDLLDGNGVIIFEIPNSKSIGFRLTKHNWFHLDTPRHLFFYSYECLKEILSKFNLEVIHFSGNPIDYSQDLPISVLKKINNTNFVLKIVQILILLPLSAFVRLVSALFLPRISEISTYVLRKTNNCFH